MKRAGAGASLGVRLPDEASRRAPGDTVGRRIRVSADGVGRTAGFCPYAVPAVCGGRIKVK